MLQLAMFHDRFDGSKPILAIFRGMNSSYFAVNRRGAKFWLIANQVEGHCSWFLERISHPNGVS
jgi:ribosomal protein L7Ae-like RNA K-turn-binding protein